MRGEIQNFKPYAFVDGKPVFPVNPNDCCFDLGCEACGGRIWIGTNDQFDHPRVEIWIGREVGISWYAPRYELPDPEKVMWVIVAGYDEENESYYVEPKGGWTK